jgi:hypothetical protein
MAKEKSDELVVQVRIKNPLKVAWLLEIAKGYGRTPGQIIESMTDAIFEDDIAMIDEPEFVTLQ